MATLKCVPAFGLYNLLGRWSIVGREKQVLVQLKQTTAQIFYVTGLFADRL